VEKRLAEQRISIALTDKARDWLADKGYDPVFGARPLRRAVQRYLENPLASRILAGDFKEGERVQVDADEAGKALTFAKAMEAARAA
jgi:ATP-dependent Clp protease ATP-binding subunit ClpB